METEEFCDDITKSEKAVQADILEKVGQHPDIRIWRVNVGLAYGFGVVNRLIGFIQSGFTIKSLEIIKKMRPVKYGVNGMSDLQGFCSYESKSGLFARFLGIEVKKLPRVASEEQILWGKMVESRGGIWILAYSVNDVWERLEKEGFERK